MPPGCSRPARRAETGAGAPRHARARGASAESYAAAWLEARGLRVLLRNFHRRRGELDLVALHGEVLVVVEVRSRRSAAFGGAAASVIRRKQRRIVLAAQQLLQARPDLARRSVRFDVLALTAAGGQQGSGTPDAAPWQVEWIRHAFEA